MTLEEVTRYHPSMDGAPDTEVDQKILTQERLVVIS